jgi:choline dehydrogenase
MAADVVIVGAGSAGNVLAARLTEDADREVVLVEAGPDYRTVADLPPEIRSGLRPVYTHDWGYRADTALGGRVLDANRARIVGGCSATNAALAVRGRPADYDGWAALGCDGWSLADVLPYFCRLERDFDFDGAAHGRDGPFPVRRPAPEEVAPVQRAFLDACASAGFPIVEDHNAPGADGHRVRRPPAHGRRRPGVRPPRRGSEPDRARAHAERVRGAVAASARRPRVSGDCSASG